MPPELVAIPVFFILSTAVVIMRRWQHKEKMAGLNPATDTRALDDRLRRIEQSIEAMAIEMERVGEGQRFVTKLLAERTPALPNEQAEAKLGNPSH